MKRLKEFHPTPFDSRSNMIGSDEYDNRSEWYVLPVMKTRDATVLDESNFDSALELLKGYDESVEVHSFGHWACGWYELILIESDSEAQLIAEGIVKELENYPVVNEDHYSNLQYERASEYWQRIGLNERKDYVVEGDSVFCIRHDSLSALPSDTFYNLMESFA